MDILVYSNLKNAYSNVDTVMAKKVLSRNDLTKDQARWVSKFSTIHLGNVLSNIFSLDSTILSQCANYFELVGNANAIKEVMKVQVLYDAFNQDFNLQTLDILQNYPSIAIGYLQNENFLEEVCKTRDTLKELVKNESYCNVVYSTISNHRATILKTLGTTSDIVNVGNGSGTFTDKPNTPCIHIPISVYDDNDTDYSVYSNSSTYRVAYIPRHSGNMVTNNGVCLRGAKVTGSGNTVGYVRFYYYNLA